MYRYKFNIKTATLKRASSSKCNMLQVVVDIFIIMPKVVLILPFLKLF